NYIKSSKNQYAYKLEGFDDEWHFSGTKRSATYTNLDPGKYTFRVKASNNDGIWNEQGATLSIIVTPPVWGTWWFKLVSFLLVVGTLVSLIVYRIRAMEAQKVILKNQVDERTRELILQKEEMEVQADILKAMNREMADQQEEVLIEREEAEKARQEADRANQAKSAFLATMSHEIR